MKYPAELKQQAIEMAITGNKPSTQVARDLDINVNTLYAWIDQHKKNNPGEFPVLNKTKQPVNLEAENRRLHKELIAEKQDVELLKKAAVYFAGHRK